MVDMRNIISSEYVYIELVCLLCILFTVYVSRIAENYYCKIDNQIVLVTRRIKKMQHSMKRIGKNFQKML